MLYILEKTILHNLIERLRSIDGVSAIVLFGSVARGEHRPDSDIDIAVELDNDSKIKLIDEIADDLYAEFGVPITIIKIIKGAPSKAPIPLIKNIRKEGVILWKRKNE